MTNAKPIIFSGPMVRAILDGRKTMTRRIVKSENKKPRWDVGDLLWVREAWAGASAGGASTDTLYYKASGVDQIRFKTANGWRAMQPGRFMPPPSKWSPSIHMPRWASRLTLKVTAVKVERLQDISEEDAKAEGPPEYKPRLTAHEIALKRGSTSSESYREDFMYLWNSIHGHDAWAVNPMVAAITFERLEHTS